MEIKITNASMSYLEDCKAALLNSKLGREYFPEEENAVSTLTHGITQQEIFVALNNEGECLGFIWYVLNGAFHSFPYLHIIAVKEEFRGKWCWENAVKNL